MQERAISIDMKHLTESQIFSQLSKLIGLETIKATPEEEATLQSIKEEKAVRRADAERSIKQRDQRRREADMLRQAKGEMVAQTA
jgi:large subunit ribosomal protein MRP49